ncbi:MAG: cell division protein ZapA [Proteobacteria bacterium]|nr:cell division protein ZapA [Pseudomonadota bacterium]
MSKQTVSVTIAGQEYRVRSDADEAWLRQVARYVDEAMETIRRRTGTIDSLDVAVLTCLNLAREILSLRTSPNAGASLDPGRVKALLELVEGALDPPAEATGANP